MVSRVSFFSPVISILLKMSSSQVFSTTRMVWLRFHDGISSRNWHAFSVDSQETPTFDLTTDLVAVNWNKTPTLSAFRYPGGPPEIEVPFTKVGFTSVVFGQNGSMVIRFSGQHFRRKPTAYRCIGLERAWPTEASNRTRSRNTPYNRALECL
jgi:hypothetical protein